VVSREAPVKKPGPGPDFGRPGSPHSKKQIPPRSRPSSNFAQRPTRKYRPPPLGEPFRECVPPGAATPAQVHPTARSRYLRAAPVQQLRTASHSNVPPSNFRFPFRERLCSPPPPQTLAPARFTPQQVAHTSARPPSSNFALRPTPKYRPSVSSFPIRERSPPRQALRTCPNQHPMSTADPSLAPNQKAFAELSHPLRARSRKTVKPPTSSPK
jgi:hypothetical protein